MLGIKEGDLLILDFDDTIWIWKRNVTYDRPDFLKMRMRGESSYQDRYGNIYGPARNIISYAKAIGIKVVILSVMNNSYEYSDKCDLLKREFGIEESSVVFVSKSEDKPIMISYLMELYNTSSSNTHFIDDNKDILVKCKETTGINIYTTMEIQ